MRDVGQDTSNIKQKRCGTLTGVMKKVIHNFIFYILSILALFISSVLVFTINTWDNISMNEVVFHLHNIDGTGGGIVQRCIFFIIIPFVIFNICFFYANKLYKRVLFCMQQLLLIVCIIIFVFNYNFKMHNFISTLKPSKFIEDNYVNPEKIEIKFKEKRNLIHIYLESIETTYTDINNGGVFTNNLIPELTMLARSNISFSGDMDKLNGAYSLYGTTWTTGAIFAQSTGAPLNSYRALRIKDSFYPGIIGIGDILNNHGYTQIFLLGSDASFAAKDIFFKDHKNFTIIDYKYLVDNHIVQKDYYIHWGIEDSKLFDIAKDTLINIANKDKPFNLVILTVDTHPPDGFLNASCKKEFIGNDYRNVILCSDTEVTKFVKWIQAQEFYKNTTVVITGDHLTKQRYKDNIISIDKNITRKNYTCYINTIHKNFTDKKYREYSVFDHFPTILSAIGADIQGNRLGLGTNLFSDDKTLLEQYGYEFVNSELSQQSMFLENLSKVPDDDFYNFVALPKKPVLKKCVGSIDYIEHKNENKAINFGGWVVHSLKNQQEPIKTILLLKGSSSDGKPTHFEGMEKLSRPDIMHHLSSSVHNTPGFLGKIPDDENTYWIGYIYGNTFYQCTNFNISKNFTTQNNY